MLLNCGDGSSSAAENDSAGCDPTLVRAFTGHSNVVTAFAFRPNGQQLASGSLDGQILLWGIRPGARPLRFSWHRAAITSLHFNPAGTLLASSSLDCTVRLCTPSIKGNCITMKAHVAPVRKVQFSEDGRNLLTCSDDKSIKIWNLSSSAPRFLHSLIGHTHWVRAAAFAPGSATIGGTPSMLASGSDDRTVRIWDVRERRAVAVYDDVGSAVLALAFQPHSGVLLAGACESEAVFEAAAGASKTASQAASSRVQQNGSRAHTSSSAQRATQRRSGALKVWDVRMHRVVQAYPTAGAVSVSVANSHALTASPCEGVVKMFDLTDGHMAYTLHGHEAPPSAAEFSTTSDSATGNSMGCRSGYGERIATGSCDGQVFLWQWKGKSSSAARTQQNTETKHKARVATDTGCDQIEVGTALSNCHQESGSDENLFGKDSNILKTHGDGSLITSRPQDRTLIPQNLASALESIVSQLDVLTSTMNIIEQRLSNCEDKIKLLSD